MKRKLKSPNWRRLARSARTAAEILPGGTKKDTLLSHARRYEAAANRAADPGRRP